jgi:hypothetical protein
MISRIKRLLLDIYNYARRHPVKVFLLVIMPLITGGILQKLLATIGIRLPSGLMGGNIGGAGRSGLGDFGNAGGSGLSESVNRLMSIAKMFI